MIFLDCLSRSDSIEHTIQVLNHGETVHEISLFVTLDDSEQEFGPRSVPEGTSWTVTKYERSGRLSIECSVDDKPAWSDEYEIPMDEYGPEWALQIILRPDEEVDNRFLEEV